MSILTFLILPFSFLLTVILFLSFFSFEVFLIFFPLVDLVLFFFLSVDMSSILFAVRSCSYSDSFPTLLCVDKRNLLFFPSYLFLLTSNTFCCLLNPFPLPEVH